MRWLILYKLDSKDRPREFFLDGPDDAIAAGQIFRERTRDDVIIRAINPVNLPKPKGRTIRKPRKPTVHSIYKAMRK